MWGQMKEWLAAAAIDKSPELEEDLISPGYLIDKHVRIQLEAKDKIKDRLGRSTDDGDALALTFAMPVVAPTVRDRYRNVHREVARAWG